MLKGQVETIVSFHIQNISNSKAERNTVPLVGNTCMGVGRENGKCAFVVTQRVG